MVSVFFQKQATRTRRTKVVVQSEDVQQILEGPHFRSLAWR